MWQFVNGCGNKFSYKRSTNIFRLFGQFVKRPSSSVKTYVALFWATFGKHWASFFPTSGHTESRSRVFGLMTFISLSDVTKTACCGLLPRPLTLRQVLPSIGSNIGVDTFFVFTFKKADDQCSDGQKNFLHIKACS